jgi:hypothetical protein
MTPRKPKSQSTLFSSHASQQAYRQHLITGNAIYGCYYISRDGFNMGSANNLAEAKAKIDQLLD